MAASPSLQQGKTHGHMTAMIASQVLPYVKNQGKWIMLAARTSKALSVYLDVGQHHWENRFKKLLAKLRSGQARCEIRRFVSCCMGDAFVGRNTQTLNGFAFTISIEEAAPRSFARQAVPQFKQIMRIMKDWNACGNTSVRFTAKKVKAPRKAGCGQMHFVGAIPIRTASTPTALVSGNLEALANWVESEDDESGYDTGESWECECGESYSASG